MVNPTTQLFYISMLLTMRPEWQGGAIMQYQSMEGDGMFSPISALSLLLKMTTISYQQALWAPSAA